MAKMTRAEYLALSSELQALATIASGKNPDDTDFTLDTAGAGGGIQYADGATAATPTGTAIAWNDAGTERIASATKPLPVEQGAITSTNTILAGKVTCTGAADQIVAARSLRQTVVIRNESTTIDLYLGPSGVDSTTGLLLKALESVPLDTQAAVFGYAASGSVVAGYLEMYGS